MRSKLLLSKSDLIRTRRSAADALPIRVADLDGFELTAQCDRCGHHLRLYPGHADFGHRTRMVSLLDRLSCRTRRDGHACGGRPRRLILARDERQWSLDHAGEWAEDEAVYWESADFEAIAERHR